MNAITINEIRETCKSGCDVRFSGATVLGIINYYEKQILTMAQREKSNYKDYLVHVQELEEEKRVLLQQIERAIEDQNKQLPVIPLEVAEAIIYARNAWQHLEEDIDRHFLNTHRFDSSKHGAVLKNFAEANPRTYMKAIADGYTVEQVPEEPTHDEQLQACIEDAIKDWQTSPIYQPKLSTVIANRVTEFLAEQNT